MKLPVSVMRCSSASSSGWIPSSHIHIKILCLNAFLQPPPSTYQVLDSSTHELHLICGWPPSLRKAQAPLDALQILSRALVTQDMGRILVFV
jgi:hypothetical protein